MPSDKKESSLKKHIKSLKETIKPPTADLDKILGAAEPKKKKKDAKR